VKFHDDTPYRGALRNPVARGFVAALESRGITLRLHDGRVQARPYRALTDLDRWTLRQHAADVRTLVEYRACWSDWWTRPAPTFDPHPSLPQRRRDPGEDRMSDTPAAPHGVGAALVARRTTMQARDDETMGAHRAARFERGTE